MIIEPEVGDTVWVVQKLAEWSIEEHTVTQKTIVDSTWPYYVCNEGDDAIIFYPENIYRGSYWNDGEFSVHFDLIKAITVFQTNVQKEIDAQVKIIKEGEKRLYRLTESYSEKPGKMCQKTA